MSKGNNIYKSLSIIFGLMFLGTFILLLLVPTEKVECPNIEEKDCPKLECPEIKEKECEKECPKQEEKALLHIHMYNWGENIYDNSELLFDYWIINYGGFEAKNIKVRCKLDNQEGKTIFSTLHHYGNLASFSGDMGELLTKKSIATEHIDENKEYLGYCYVESCDNCEILYKRIPKYIKSLEG